MKRIIVLVMSVILPALLFVGVTAQTSFVNYTTTDGLANDFVSGGVCIDQSNVKWFGTQAGVSKFNGTTWTTYTTDDGLIDNYINCIAYDNTNNKIWIGTSNGVSVFDGTSFVNYTSADGLIDNSTMDIDVDDSGNAWVTSFSGMSKIDSGVITNFTSVDGMSSDLTTRVLAEGSNLYIGTLNAGFMIYDGSSFQAVGTVDGLLDNYVSAIEVDDEGNIYVGSYKGLTVFNASLTVTNTYTLAVELFNDYIQDVVVDGNGNLVILEYADYLSDGGITVFNGTTWTLYTATEGLIDVMVKKADLDSEGNIWITTGSGVSKMSLGSSVESNYISAESFIYPNPATDFIKIANLEGEFSYQITDITGRVIANEQNVKSNYIDISNLPNSVYFINFENKGNLYSAKIIVE